MDKISCYQCKFYRPDEDDKTKINGSLNGQCLRYPPKIHITPRIIYQDKWTRGYVAEGGNEITRYPQVTNKDFCGEFKDRHAQ